ncbi:uncharacterized protein LOC143041753 [Oratosquilla oratoria]|uniref:uncharacterized protein LOC143041753 n=1 Tax=Oratosquilla oratoria TaxID=337810 RepID=UPI003F759F3C
MAALLYPDEEDNVPITEKELRPAMTSTETSAPGDDGITYQATNFYWKFLATPSFVFSTSASSEDMCLQPGLQARLFRYRKQVLINSDPFPLLHASARNLDLHVPEETVEPDLPPWRISLPNVTFTPTSKDDLPALQKQLALETIDSVSSKIPAAHVIYVDGSVQADGRAACAMYSPTLQPPVEAGWIGRRLPVTSSSTFCELHGILDAVTYLVDCNVNGVIVCDSQPALHALSSPRPNYYRVVQAILTQLAVAHEASMAVSFIWVPSHVDLAGNDTVDRLAKAACAFVLDNERVVPSLTCLKNRIHAATHIITTCRRDAERATSVSIQHYDHFLPSRHKYRRRGPMKQ